MQSDSEATDPGVWQTPLCGEPASLGRGLRPAGVLGASVPLHRLFPQTRSSNPPVPSPCLPPKPSSAQCCYSPEEAEKEGESHPLGHFGTNTQKDVQCPAMRLGAVIMHLLPCSTPLCPTIQLAGLITLWAQLPAPTRYPVPKRTLAGQGEKLFCSSQTWVAGKCRAPGSHPTPKLCIV